MMRLISIIVVLGTLAVGAQAAKPRPHCKSPDGSRLAEVRARASGGDGLYVDGAQVWPTPGHREHPQIVTPVVWSRGGDAVALVARGSAGNTTLVVAIVAGDAAGRALSWPIPKSAGALRSIMWLGPTRVAVGPREMEPKVVASWTVSQ